MGSTDIISVLMVFGSNSQIVLKQGRHRGEKAEDRDPASLV